MCAEIMPYMFFHVRDDYAIYSTMNMMITMCMLTIPNTFNMYMMKMLYLLHYVNYDNAIYVHVEYAIYFLSST